jgi:hypothetical protein
MTIKYTNKALQNLPKLGFLVLKYTYVPSINPDVDLICDRWLETLLAGLLQLYPPRRASNDR